MCTMTWLRQDGGYHVFFNRDERRTRKPAAPPSIHETGRGRFIAPRDGDFGGTWLAANELGVTLALHNAYTAPEAGLREPPGGYTSRGLLVARLADAAGIEEVRGRLGDLALGSFRGFLLTVFAADGTANLVRWTGTALDFAERDALRMPLVSSSFDTDEVRVRRVELFRRLMLESNAGLVERHLAYHASHLPARGAYSPCMHRPDAMTVSFSWVRVTADRVEYRYAPHPPCRGVPDGEAVVLPRAVPRPPAVRPRSRGAETSGR